MQEQRHGSSAEHKSCTAFVHFIFHVGPVDSDLDSVISKVWWLEMPHMRHWLLMIKRSDPEPIGSGSSQAALVRFMTPGP